ncbi:MAG: ATP-binding cassette domain-containing protein [Oscillospiraceae bacterium]|jgi:ATPase subunit of ABC transporter with duplicated ATPase domains|nr:ATP-binding cassette domain-containing protein [Oscillospiraceae bacterium]
MITISDLSLSFGERTLFEDVNLKFTAGNCYGVIGANGAGKSTFLKMLSSEIEPSTGEIALEKGLRMSILKQDHYAFNNFSVLDAIIVGNKELYNVSKQKEEVYTRENFSDEDGILAAELEARFAELGGWEIEAEAGKLLKGLGLSEAMINKKISDINSAEKVKVLLAQALFGNPDILLMDEPTNHLDVKAVDWLEEFLTNYGGTVIVVSHDRHFLNQVCTHTIDIDYKKIKMYVGNYQFWYESSILIQRTLKQQNKKREEKIKDLQNFIQRFSANKSKSKQATSRKRLFEKLTVDEMPASSRKYPFISFGMDREAGDDILTVKKISKIINKKKIFDNFSLTLGKGEKVAFKSKNELAVTVLFEILMGKIRPDSGKIKWGISTSKSYFPKDSTMLFKEADLTILDWMRQYTKEDKTETYLRTLLGRMLFSSNDVFKKIKVLSGGEKVRCLFSRMMLFEANVLLLDQPTNHLDLEAITALNKGLEKFKGNIVFSSHDREFVETIATKVVEF